MTTITVRPMSKLSRRSSLSAKSMFNFSQKSFFVGDEKLSRKIFDSLKLVSLVLPPIAIVITLCGLSMAASKAAIDAQAELQSNLLASQKVGLVATLMAQERGSTCLYLSAASDNDSTIAFNKVKGIRVNVDYSIGNITQWLGTKDDGEGFKNKEHFLALLNMFRKSIVLNATQCTTGNGTLWWYTDKINKFIEQMNREFQNSLDGQFWAAVSSYHEILMAKDLIGIRRALGSSFFARGQFPLTDYATFSRISGAADYLLNSSLALTPNARIQYDNLRDKQTKVVNSLEAFSKIINANDPSNPPDATIGIQWFDNMTAYINIIDAVQTSIGALMIKHVEDVLNDDVINFRVTNAIIAIVLIVCPATTICYAIQSKKMMQKIKKFTTDLKDKTKELDAEKKKTDLLLFQMLPKSIVVELKLNKHVAPEMFDSVTVYFSDIQGFTTLSGQSTPFEVVELLNMLYTKFDDVLDQYDVYKVETIGDAYMVASGLPKRNGSKHSSEVCTTALHLLWSLESMSVPHKPKERLLLRIGLHTGPCAAGVVGQKMPRYCLFGDTVNTASRMESNGKALRVHLSPSIYEHLLENHPGAFDFVPREKITVKGKGLMQTYWLLGKKDFPFRVDLAETVRVAEATTYWRLDNADNAAI